MFKGVKRSDVAIALVRCTGPSSTDAYTVAVDTGCFPRGACYDVGVMSVPVEVLERSRVPVFRLVPAPASIATLDALGAAVADQ